jgi:hypothetical protein
MSQGESSPPYDPNQPATASTSMPKVQKTSFAMSSSCLQLESSGLAARLHLSW